MTLSKVGYWAGEYDAGMDDLGCLKRNVEGKWPGSYIYDALLEANSLCYRLMSYIYSLAGMVWKEDATILRMLAFDFAFDEKTRNINDQFLFGKSLMVCPVTRPMYLEADSRSLENSSRTRDVYLPEGVCWYDYYTGEKYRGGQTIQADAPIGKIPLYVKERSMTPVTVPAKMQKRV